MSIIRAFASFKDNIGEEGRWNGRTQSSDSWSPEQLRRILKLEDETAFEFEDETAVEFEDETDFEFDDEAVWLQLLQSDPVSPTIMRGQDEHSAELQYWP